MKKNIEINNNMLTKDEILYLSELLKNRNDWKYQTYFDQPRQYFDSLYVDVNKLKKYYELICENGKYEIILEGQTRNAYGGNINFRKKYDLIVLQ